MKIVMTAEEMIDKGIWGKYCELTDKNVWAVNEGILDNASEITLSEDEAIELGIIPDNRF